MYKAIIVDDEKKICSLILELGNWEEYGIEVAAVCYDGEEALQKIQEHRPDLVLTDVRMPVYDGLELIKRTTELGIKPSFVIISGYKYFEYAYSAFKYGVIDYLLKPIDGEQLNEVLRKVVDLMDAKKRLASTEDALRQLNRNMEQSHHRQMFDDLFAGKSFPSDQEMLAERYHKEFPLDSFQVFFLKTNRNLQEESSLLLTEKITGAAKRIFSEDVTVCTEIVLEGIGGILNFAAGQEERTWNLLHTFLTDIREVAEMFGNQQVTIGVGPVVRDLSELPASARSARNAEQAKISLGANRLLQEDPAQYSQMTAAMLLTDKRRREYETLLETVNPEGMETWFAPLLNNWDQGKPPRPEVLTEVRDKLLQGAEKCSEKQQAQDAARELRRITEIESDEADGPREFFHILMQHLVQHLEGLRREMASREKLPIRLAKAYIDEHYSETVTLEDTAAKVGLSSSYFSTSFKKFEKRTFSEYLTSVRMEAAKELLATTRKTNYEIALSVGYTDDKYFCKVFKKEVGIRPGEYRKLYFNRK